jgi:integrase
MMKNNAQSERYAGVASPWLFPGESDGHKTETTLSGQIIDRITKEIGIRVTPHQFRHLAAAFILETRPITSSCAAFSVTRTCRPRSTSMNVGLETVEADRKFSAMALEDIAWRPAP